MDKKYAHLTNEKSIKRAFNKANQRYQYVDACYLYDKYPTIIQQCQYSKILNNLRRYLDSYKINFYIPWGKLSNYEQNMIISILDYDLIKHLWENKLITKPSLRYIAYKIESPKIFRYLFTVVRIPNRGRIFEGCYKAFMNQSDLYLLIHLALSKVDNELLHIAPLACHIHEFMDNSNFHVLRWTDDITYDESINDERRKHDVTQMVSTARLTDRLLLDNPPRQYIRNDRGNKMFYLVTSLQIFAFGAILLKALV